MIEGESVVTSNLMPVLGTLIVAMLGWIVLDLRSFKTQVHRDFSEVRGDIADLRERMARLEGLFEGFTKREAAK